MSELANPSIDLIIVPPTRDLGGFEVRRALPSRQRHMVGPFIFLDQMGPAQFAAGQGVDVRPHPHIGLATVTYLFSGSLMHRDSEGNAVEITPGAMNLMTAGRGIAHSERTPVAARQSQSPLFGIQSWLALPTAHEETEPTFQRFAAEQLPTVEDTGLHARVIAGSAFGQRSPVSTASEWLYAEVRLQAGVSAPLEADQEERAIYVAEGEIEIARERFAAPQLLVFRPGDRITVTATRASRLMFLGGAGIDGPRYIWWNFVSSSQERIEQAKADWKADRFRPVPGETEFIPLPDL
ncbi:MAG TPA: pirin family protein [Povalibacter sp.]|uniref:pirin family protein n=1 Tax=Povalibacter sp. TaxID=1962978 RepID=UPI002CEDA457|nr:pirin family protein [Povalibacter sp.]HMN45172.1 pirin family protein [Povalibacter sp.]